MQTEHSKVFEVELFLHRGTLHKLTSLLQSGIKEQATCDEPIGRFLEKLPGFTEAYIANDIQTIFLNGNPVDDLETPLTSRKATIALSAAMPGLAGAIFRRNSLHAALRKTSPPVDNNQKHAGTVSIQLKLFNAVAANRGPGLFQKGVSLSSKTLSQYLQTRPSIQSDILIFQVNGTGVNWEDLLELLEAKDFIFLLASEANEQ